MTCLEPRLERPLDTWPLGLSVHGHLWVVGRLPPFVIAVIFSLFFVQGMPKGRL